jgi:hypothetical protein
MSKNQIVLNQNSVLDIGWGDAEAPCGGGGAQPVRDAATRSPTKVADKKIRGRKDRISDMSGTKLVQILRDERAKSFLGNTMPDIGHESLIKA